jgi:hypothetical protein
MEYLRWPIATPGFINEMRKVAMKLHTKEQAPKEGGKAAPAQPQAVRAHDAAAKSHAVPQRFMPGGVHTT